MSQTDGRVKEAQLDYLSLTFRPGWNREAARARVETLQGAEDAEGERAVPFRLRGYHGVAVGRVAWGDRPDGSLLQLAGAPADLEASVLLPLASNCTRVDLAVTARVPKRLGSPVVKGYKAGLTYQPERGKPPAYSLLQHSQLGATLYVGSPDSDRRGRVYNKFTQSQQEYYAGCFRWECQLQRRLAPKAAARVLAQVDRKAYIKAYVARYFSERQVPVYFDPKAPDVALDTFRPRTSDLSRVMWLGRAVAPVVQGLIARGRWAEVQAALGGSYAEYAEQGLPADVGEWLNAAVKPRVFPVPPGPELA